MAQPTPQFLYSQRYLKIHALESIKLIVSKSHTFKHCLQLFYFDELLRM